MTLKWIPTIALLVSFTFTPLASAMIQEEGPTQAPHVVINVNKGDERLPFIDEQGQDALNHSPSRQQEQTCITDRCFLRTIATICTVGVLVLTLIGLKNAHYF